ncbi:MAG TPA: M48 family metalloprotease [Kofleriaceae bacterium]|nr:M48 family metalloprotease [Kofleriaceae bacterium]
MTHRTAKMAAVALAGAWVLVAAGVAEAQEAPPPPPGAMDLYGGRPARKPSKKQREIERHLFTAQYFLLQAQDLDGAASEYRAVLKLDKGNVMAGMALADVEVQRKKPRLAIKVLETVGRKAKRDGRIWRALAMAHKAAGDDRKMVAACRKALTIDARDGEALWMLFERALERNKRGDKGARAELEASAKGYLASGYLPEGPQHRMVEHTLLELSGDEVGLAVYDAKAAYNDAFADGGMGSINQQMAAARSGFEKCVAAAPDRQECHYYLGLVYGSVKASESYDLGKAKASLRRAPDMPEAHVELARLLRVEDDLDGAARELGVAIKLAPGNAVAHLELGIVRKLDGNEDAAVDSFVAAYQADRFSSTADRAVSELAKMRPRHPLVTGALMQGGDIKGTDVFSTDRFKAAVKLVEEQMGGVEEGAPEQAVLEEILSRLRRSGDVSSRYTFSVAVLKTEMVNAFALPDGSIYFTRGLFDFLKKKWPRRKLDATNDILAHVMAHEMTHVIRRHTLQTLIYQEAIRDSSRPLDPAILTHVTRLHEVEADREGIVLAFLAGYHPRGGIEFMEVSGKEMEIPPHLDHPTYEERVHYLEEYWTNDVRYAFVSFKLGLATLDRAARLEFSDPSKVPEAYELAVDHFKRFRTTLKGNKEVLNNLGIAYAKLGVMSMARSGGSPLLGWQTRFSVERNAALRYRSLQRDEDEPRTRGGGAPKKPAVPWQLREAMAAFDEALHIDSRYGKAQLNMALVQLALGRSADAHRRLAALAPSGERDLLIGVASAEEKRWAESEAALTRASKFAGLARAARYDLARMYQLSSRRDKANAAYRAYLLADRDKASPWAQAAQRALKQPQASR